MTEFNQQALKEKVASYALKFLEDGMTLGVGSGSTVLCFIKALEKSGLKFKDIVCASNSSAEALRQVGYEVSDLNNCDSPDLYIDGCDEIDGNYFMIKGGGAALTREKIIAAASKQFLCIIDESKKVETLGNFPIPIEVIPMARSFVAREIVKLGGDPVWRQSVITDNGNWILDVHNLMVKNPLEFEREVNQIAGVVCCGIFAKNPAHKVLMSKKNGEIIEF